MRDRFTRMTASLSLILFDFVQGGTPSAFDHGQGGERKLTALSHWS